MTEPGEAKIIAYQYYGRGGVDLGQQVMFRRGGKRNRGLHRLLRMEPTRDDCTTRSSHFTSARIYDTSLAALGRRHVMFSRTATISSTLRVFETRQKVEAIRRPPQLTLTREYSRVTLQVDTSAGEPKGSRGEHEVK